mgnify:FL=1
MTKWPVDGSVAVRPEGVLQNVRENSGLATVITTRPSLISRGRDRRPHRVCIFKSLLAVLRPAIWFDDWTEVCPGKCLLTGQTGSEMSFVRCKWGFLRHYRCMVEGLMSINYLKLCDFVKYVL